jgi:hypothetical protein
MNPDQMSQESMSMVMFWVGGMFALMPILIVSMIIGTTWYLRRKKKTSEQSPPG